LHLRRPSKEEVLLSSIPFAIFFLTLHGSETGPLFNVVANQFSMWKYHSFGLGSVGGPIADSVPNTDTFVFHGTYYDTYAPGLAILSFPFAAIGFQLDAGTLSHFGYSVLLDESFIALCASVSVVLVYRIARWYAPNSESMLGALALAFATLVWPFSTVTYDHDVTLVFSLASVYLLMRDVRQNSSIFVLLWSGTFLGVASLTDYLSALFFIPLVGYLLLVSEKIRVTSVRNYVTKLVSFVVPAVFVGSINLLYNHVIFGNFFTFPEQFWMYAPISSSQSGPLGLMDRFSFEGLGAHLLLNLVSPYRGLLLLCPVLIFGFYGLYKMIRFSQTRIDGIFLLSLFLTNLLPYSAWDVWTGGNTFGPRFLIYGLPYIAIPIAFALYRNRRLFSRALFLGLFAVSSLIDGAAAFTYAYQPGSDNVLLYQPAAFVFPDLLRSEIGAWWFRNGIITSQIVAWIIIAATFAGIWAFVFYAAKLKPLEPGVACDSLGNKNRM
jgi:hypothetical protein